MTNRNTTVCIKCRHAKFNQSRQAWYCSRDDFDNQQSQANDRNMIDGVLEQTPLPSGCPMILERLIVSRTMPFKRTPSNFERQTKEQCDQSIKRLDGL